MRLVMSHAQRHDECLPNPSAMQGARSTCPTSMRVLAPDSKSHQFTKHKYPRTSQRQNG